MLNVGEMQRKLSLWAEQDRGRKFYGLFDLICNRDWLWLAYERVAQLVNEMGKVEHISVAESSEEVGQQLVQVLRKTYQGDLPVYKLGAVLGTHTGPGTAAVAVIVAP